MHKNDHDNGAHSRELNPAKIESIEDLLRSRGFFDGVERSQKNEDVLVS